MVLKKWTGDCINKQGTEWNINKNILFEPAETEKKKQNMKQRIQTKAISKYLSFLKTMACLDCEEVGLIFGA